MNRSLLNHLATFSLPILLYSLDFGFTKDKRTFSNPEFYSFTSQLLFQLNFLLLAVTLQSFLIELNQWQTVNLWQVVAVYLRVSWVLFHKGRLWLWIAINCYVFNLRCYLMNSFLWDLVEVSNWLFNLCLVPTF